MLFIYFIHCRIRFQLITRVTLWIQQNRSHVLPIHRLKCHSGHQTFSSSNRSTICRASPGGEYRRRSPRATAWATACRELTPPLICMGVRVMRPHAPYNGDIWESWPCTSPGQHSRADTYGWRCRWASSQGVSIEELAQLHRLQHLEELASCLDWAAQWMELVLEAWVWRSQLRALSAGVDLL